MKQYQNDQMTYTHDWVLFDEENARVVFCARTQMPDLGDGRDYSTTNWSMIDYAGNGQWSREEDIYKSCALRQPAYRMASSEERGQPVVGVRWQWAAGIMGYTS